MDKSLELYLNRRRNVDLFLKFNLSRSNLYDLLGDFEVGVMSKQLLEDTVKRIYKKEYGWEHPVFNEARLIVEEENYTLLNPFQIEEGVLECHSCGSKRTYSFERQTRSADEGSTTFAQCAVCLKSWRIYN
jgi:DNA-directed RNA polymerase subunit M/transcription elongation factor TFIIS